MAESVNVPIPESIPAKRNGSAWAPLREPLFRSLWIAAVISYTGTWMQNVGAGWLMTQLTVLTSSPGAGVPGRRPHAQAPRHYSLCAVGPATVRRRECGPAR